MTTENYKDWANIVKTRYDINTDDSSVMKQVVDAIETEHSGSPFGKFTAYITIDDIKPVEDTKHLKQETNRYVGGLWQALPEQTVVV